jgi:predicted enzyme related to lactoylglutathione lyase
MPEASTPTGKFVWYEYMGDNLKAAVQFYTGVVGSTSKDAGMANFAYEILSTGSTMVAGMMDMPKSCRVFGQEYAICSNPVARVRKFA